MEKLTTVEAARKEKEERKRKSNNEREERRNAEAISGTANPSIPYNHNLTLVKPSRREPAMQMRHQTSLLYVQGHVTPQS